LKASKAKLGIVPAKDVFASPRMAVAVADLELVKPAPAHVHEFLELAFVTAGQAVHTSDAGTTLLHPGHVVVIAAGGWHAYQPDPELHIISIRVGIEVLRELLPWLSTLPGLGYLFDAEHSSPLPSAAVAGIDSDQARAIRSAVRALAEPGMASHPQPFSRLARLLDVLGSLDALWSDRPRPLGPAPPVASETARNRREVEIALGILRSRIAEPWTLDRLADEVHMSRSQVARLFGASVGMGPMTYLRELRAQRMAELLRFSNLSVTETALRVGWTDLHYASRCFAARWGMPPTRFRQQRRSRPVGPRARP
jgi:AraC-like DNA-binding protein